ARGAHRGGPHLGRAVPCLPGLRPRHARLCMSARRRAARRRGRRPRVGHARRDPGLRRASGRPSARAETGGRGVTRPTIPVMEGRAKVTKEVLCEEARFILANVMAEARYGRQNRYDDIRRVCEGAVSIPFAEYIGFLEKSGYLRHDHTSESLEVTPDGENVVNGGSLQEFTERAVSHFKKLRQTRALQASSGVPMGS